MRSLLLALAMLCADAATIHAQVASGVSTQDNLKSESPGARLRLFASDSAAFRSLAPYNADRTLDLNFGPANGRAWQSRALSIGPLRMDIDSSGRRFDGRQTHFAHVHLDDFHVFGGDVSGTFDGRAATVRLSWPTGN